MRVFVWADIGCNVCVLLQEIRDNLKDRSAVARDNVCIICSESYLVEVAEYARCKPDPMMVCISIE